MMDYGLIPCAALVVLALALVMHPLRRQPWAYALLPLLVALLLLAERQWGGWSARWQFQHQLALRQQAQAMLGSRQGRESVIQQLQDRLRQDPQSARGWYLLGRLHLGQGSWGLAVSAFARAHALQPDDEAISINYALSLAAANHQRWTPEARALLNQVLAKNPRQPEALSLLAAEAFEQHQDQQAIDYWQRLLALLPAQSEEAALLRKAMARATARLKGSARTVQGP